MERIRLTISRLNGTGVQELKFTSLKIGATVVFEREKYTILSKQIGRGKIRTQS